MVILIVDDEHSVISSISNILIQNFEDRFEILSASSAENAFELAQTTKINLLITDIRMPGVDGIALADSIAELYQDVGIIFVSAYDQKEYLKAAIKLNAVGFIDKPVVPSELIGAVTKFMGSALKKLEKEDISKNDKKAQLLNILVTGRDTNKSAKVLFKEIYNDEIDDNAFVVSLVKNSLGAELNTIFERILNDFLVEGLQIICDKKADDLYLIMFIGSDKNTIFDLVENLLKELYQKLNTLATTIIAVSPVQSDYKLIRNSYVSTSVALEKGFYNSDAISYVEANQSFEPEKNHNLFKVLDEYSTIIRRGIKADITSFLEQTYNLIKQKKDMPAGTAKFLFKQLIYATYVSYSGIESITFFDSFGEIESMDFITFDELYAFTLSKILYSYDSVNQDKLVASVKACIENSYTNPEFSVKDVCDALHLSASHISARFKKAMGITLNNYITMVRLNHACTLIRSGKYSSNEISFMVGYNDSNYFSRIFKAHFGMTVTEYRKENAK